MDRGMHLIGALLLGLIPTFACAVDAAPLRAGDTWRYQAVDGYNGLPQGTWRQTVTAAGANELRLELRREDAASGEVSVYAAHGVLTSGRLNPRATGSLEPALQLLPFPLTEGKRWRQDVTRRDPQLYDARDVRLLGRVAGWETVKVPAGEFRAIKIIREFYLGDHDPFRRQTKLTEYEWYVPELKHWAKMQTFEEFHYTEDNAAGSYNQGDRLVMELLSFEPGR